MKSLTVNGLNIRPSTIEISNKVVTGDSLAYFSQEFEKKLLAKLTVHPTFEHKCHNCGGTLTMNIEQHIFNCPYCDSVYAIGTMQINSGGERS